MFKHEGPVWILDVTDINKLVAEINEAIESEISDAYHAGLRDSNGKGKAKGARAVQVFDAHLLIDRCFGRS